MIASAFYAGKVMHRRIRPRKHKLSYNIFSLLLDLDELDVLTQRLKLFSYNRFNLFSFHDVDYGDGSGRSLRSQIENVMREGGIETDGGPIQLLTMPRILGYAFNPISVYFCYRRTGALAAILYEVNNTFGERHGYFISTESMNSSPIRHKCPKQFYVSPFMDMDMSYSFRIVPPDKQVSLSIVTGDDNGPMLIASLSAERHPLTDAALLRAFVIYPLLTLKVIAGIHWEALRIWLKGVRLRTRPLPPSQPVTFMRARDAQGLCNVDK